MQSIIASCVYKNKSFDYINASCVYKNKSFDYINASFIYIIKAYIYSFLIMQRKFRSYTKEVYPL